MTAWLAVNVAHAERRPERVKEELLVHFRAQQIEPPTPGRRSRIVRSAWRVAEQDWSLRISQRLDPPTVDHLLNLIAPDESGIEGIEGVEDGVGETGTVLGSIKSAP